MAITDEIPMPTMEELTVQEVNVSSPVLRASAMHFGKYCDEQSKEYMLCKGELKDPRKCLDAGKEVTACALEFFRKVKKTCKDEVEWYAKCIEWNSKMLMFTFCRPEQKVYNACMKENGFERAHFGYFTQVRVHDSARPRPEYKYKHYEKLPKLPDDFPFEEPAKGMLSFMFD